MNRTRIIAIAKLVILFGGPLSLILGLFSCGVYCGVENRAGILSFERNWLGIDVDVPSESKSDGESESKSESDGESKSESKSEPKAEPETKTVAKVDPPAETPTPSNVAPQPAPTQPTEAPSNAANGVTAVPAPLPPPRTKVDPLEGPAAEAKAVEKVVQVKVLVDSHFIDSRPDWIDAVQRTVSRASHIYQEQFGIRLQLWAVGRWSVPAEGMNATAMLEDLRTRPREGAQILLGFTDRRFDGTAPELAGPPTEDDPFNGAYGVVYGTHGHRQTHLRTLLHRLGRLMGAMDITEPTDSAWKAGSWMSYAPVPESQAPWIDAVNRKRVLERKQWPFEPEPTPAPPAEPAP